MFLNILLLIIGFVLLIKGADIFVDGSSSTALNFKMSKILIGLTIVAFGTSAPEFAVSMSALAKGSPDMVLGNVIGSCITNVLLILGVAAVIKPVKVKENTVRKELPLCLLYSTVLVVLILDMVLAGYSSNQVTRSDGIILALFFSIFVYYLVTLARQKRDSDDEMPKFKLGKSLLFVVLGLLGIIYASNLVVDSATKIANFFGLSERLISLTIIAFGTSLPELVTTIVSSKKGEQDLLIGNIIGSNIFNICIVLGVPIIIYGNINSSGFQPIDLLMLVMSSLMLYIFAETKKIITRSQGIFMLLAFAIYYILVFVI